jgi:hypothetical protein
MSIPAVLVNGFISALGGRDFSAARKLLANDFVFQGPFDTFRDPESYLEALKNRQTGETSETIYRRP